MQLKTLLLLLLLSLSSTCLARANDLSDADWLALLPKPWQIEPAQLQAILYDFNNRFPDYKTRLRAIAEWRIGTPYKIFNLGEEQEPDADPLFRLDVSDCTSHVITSMTLAESNSWYSARKNITQLHYKPQASGRKQPIYNKRWHYTSDRIMNHPQTPEVSHKYVALNKMASADVVLNKKQDGTEFLALDWTMPVTVNYIPNDQITPDLLAKLPDFIGIAFVKTSYFKMGVVMSHEGMLLDGQDLLHAGQTANKTIREDFMEYYFTAEGPKFDGIMLYDFKPMNEG